MIFFLLYMLPISSIFAQQQFRDSVWKSFYVIVKLPPDVQSRSFQELQQLCLRKSLTTDSTYTNLLFLYAGSEFACGRLANAQRLLQQAIVIAAANPDRNPGYYLSKYHFYLGYYLMQSKAVDKALDHYLLSLNIGRNAVDKWGIRALACQAIAHNYYQIQDYNRALQYADLGNHYARLKGDQSALAKNIYEQCINLNELGRYKTAQKYIPKLMDIAGRYATPFELGSYYKLCGDLALNNKAYGKMRDFYLNAAAEYRRCNAVQELGGVYLDLHYVSMRIGNQAEILKYENLARQFVKNPYYLSRLHNNMAMNHARNGHYEQSFALIRQSIVDLPIDFHPKTIFDNPSAAQIRNLAEKDYPFTVLTDKAGLLLRSGKNLEQALQTFELLDTLNDYMRWEHEGSSIKLYWRTKMRNLYEQAIETCFRLKQPLKAYYFIEKSRSALLTDELNQQNAIALLPPAKKRQETQLQLQLNGLQSAESQNLKGLIAAQERLSAFYKSLEKQYPAYYEYKYNNEIPQISLLQQELQRNKQSYLSFFSGDRALYSLLVSPKQITFRKINIGPAQIATTAFKRYLLNQNLQNKDYRGFLKASNILYSVLIKPIEKQLQKRVVVAAETDIIPFAALSRSADQASYLLYQYAFSYSYSARLLLTAEKKNKIKNAADAYLGMAPVVFAYEPELSSLPASSIAVADNNRLFYSGKVLTGKAASKQNFLKNWPNYQLLQLITHAYADSLQNEPRIYFSDASLKLSEIAAVKNNHTSLLILSACRTGLGKARKGEGVYSLSRGFMASGLPSVLSSLWDLEDQDAYDLSHGVLLEMRSGKPFDLALQAAQLTWLSTEDKGRQLPYAWAGMVLIGQTRNELSDHYKPVVVGLYALFFIVSGLGVFVLIKKKNKAGTL